MPGALYEVIVRDHRRAAAVLAATPGIVDVQMFGERAHVRLEHSGGDAAEWLATRLARDGLAVEGVRPVPMSLEDVFIARLSEARS